MRRAELTWFRLGFPRDLDQDAVLAALASFTGAPHRTRLVFDLAADSEGITHRLAVSPAHADILTGGLRAAIPSLRLDQIEQPQRRYTQRLLWQLQPLHARYLTAARLRELEAALTERDLAVLQRVVGLRFVSGAQLTRLCFSGSDDAVADARMARRALLRLVRLDALARLPRPVGGVRAGSAGFVYHLGLGGQRLAITRGWQPERRRRRSLSPGTLFVRHALQVAELHTRLVEGDRSRRFELLELTPEPSCWRSNDGTGGQRAVLKPDSYVRLGVGAYEHSYFIEVDRGTEGTRALECQFQLYVSYHRSGREQAEHGVFPKVLWLVLTDRRASVIADCVRRLPKASRELFEVARFDAALAAMTDAAPEQDSYL